VLEHLVEAEESAIPLIPVAKSGLAEVLAAQPERLKSWARAAGFTAETGSICLLPNTEGGISAALVGLGDGDDPWAFAALPAKLPAATYCLAGIREQSQAEWAALGWLLACYSFGRYKTRAPLVRPRLVWPDNADRARVTRLAAATRLVRDLVNTPAADMGPGDIAAAADRLATEHGASLRVIIGEGLLAENYPMIHAVGRAAAHPRQPRLIDLVWGDETAPKLTLVGKGVCFDTGGLDLKPSSNMKLMKKDMGGAAHVLGLASMIMAAGLKVRLRVLIPAVENAVSGDAMRPLDVLSSRKGVTVEIGNTDAEGRLILADALWEAGREKPDLLIDIATLTGAARTALGPDLPALFSNDDALAGELLAAGVAQHDPLWRLPLHKPYRRMLDSKVADLCSASDSPHAGAITAALFLQEFVPAGIPWAHLDILAWNGSARPGRPDGGEAMGLRALFAAIAHRFAPS
jgi:leucyl aminopeptidase